MAKSPFRIREQKKTPQAPGAAQLGSSGLSSWLSFVSQVSSERVRSLSGSQVSSRIVVRAVFLSYLRSRFLGPAA